MQKILLILLLIAIYSSSIYASSTVEDEGGLFTGSDKVSGKIFNESCLGCHSGGTPRAPHATTFSAMSADYILETLYGVMSSQASHLTDKEKVKLAEYISGSPITTNLPEPNFCEKNSPIKFSNNSYTQWGYDRENTRNTSSNIDSQNLDKLKLKWVFAFPGATRSRSQPSVSGNVIFIGDQNAHLYALDRDDGCVRWRTKIQGEIRSAPVLEKINGKYFVFSGDYEGNVYKHDAITGENLWTKSLRYHPRVILTGSVRVYDNVIYVPLSSREWADGANPDYECCSFRGGVMALSAENGDELWRTYSIPVPPKHTGKYNESGKKILAPSGVPVWNSPTVDNKRNLIYVGTGESYTSPAADTSDSILAIDKTKGGIVWSFQAQTGDAWNMGCFISSGSGCPEENGPDWDFGASTILIDLDDDKSILFGGRKSGHVYALDPDQNGKLLWSKKIGRGGFAGGVHWGMTTDGKSIFAGISDKNYINKFPGPATPGVYSLDAKTGSLNWKFEPQDRCQEFGSACDRGISAALSSTNDIIIAAGMDGWMYILDNASGNLLWEFNTNADFSEYTDTKAYGGTIEGLGPVIAGNNLFINSGYQYGGNMPGNVLLNFELLD
tara:strand:- start:2573 stop:4408 length:1836 start_codon:yes stop_codon:yes gene_type:complete